MPLVWTDVPGDPLLWHIRWQNEIAITFCLQKPGERTADPANRYRIDKCWRCMQECAKWIAYYIADGDPMAYEYRLAPRQQPST